MDRTGRIIDVKAAVLGENRDEAARLAAAYARAGAFVVNVMGSPGSGKTALIAALLPLVAASRKPAVIEADLDSRTDADAIEALGWRAVQLRTGGFCHLDATMVEAGMHELGFDLAPDHDAGAEPGRRTTPAAEPYGFVFVENVGNLVCTAQVDTGAHLDIALLSVPEGDDKPVKYPVMFARAGMVVVTKADYLDRERFDADAVRRSSASLNPEARFHVVSARTGLGIAGLAADLLAAAARMGA